MDALYEAMAGQVSGFGTKKAEDTKRIVELEGLIEKAKRELETIQKRIRNERQLNRRHTVISTNLTMAELKERYTERVSSRLLDETSWRRLVFTGSDVRKKLKRGKQ